MNHHRRPVLVLGLLIVLNANASAAEVPTATIHSVERFALPGVQRDGKPSGYVDCNSPAHWDGQIFYVFSSDGRPWRASGPDLLHLERKSEATEYDNKVNGGRWVESTHKDEGGKLYGWYHREPGGLCPEQDKAKHHLTAPLIGAVVSDDNGMHWHDLGIVLEAPKDSKFCETPNKYFAGGNGDFSVILDRAGDYFYFFISTYNKDMAEQGVSLARMKYSDRDAPVGKVQKWHDGDWKEPGLGGHITPVFPVKVDWHKENADTFWGASIHYNTYLQQYVVLLNRAKDKNWAMEGVYISFNADVANPAGWSKPVKILDSSQLEGSKWYPQVIGTDPAGRETDKLAGQTTRLFVAGSSKWEIVFRLP